MSVPKRPVGHYGRSMRPIPTTFAGMRFRSRLEADMAQLLNLVRLDWHYEAASFLLTSGVHYRPDYYLRDADTWVEVRGYDSELGRSQILGFERDLQMGKLSGSYAVVDLTGSRWTDTNEHGCQAVLLLCDECGRWSFGPEASLRCGLCGHYGNRSVVWDVGVKEGALKVGDPLGRWVRPIDFGHETGLVRRQTLDFTSVGEVLKNTSLPRNSTRRGPPAAERSLSYGHRRGERRAPTG